jgi:hypothetical protein
MDLAQIDEVSIDAAFDLAELAQAAGTTWRRYWLAGGRHLTTTMSTYATEVYATEASDHAASLPCANAVWARSRPRSGVQLA